MSTAGISLTFSPFSLPLTLAVALEEERNSPNTTGGGGAGGGGAGEKGGGGGGNDRSGEQLNPKQRHQMKHRELFLSRQVETLPATQIRAKCSVTLLNEEESLLSYLNKDVSSSKGSTSKASGDFSLFFCFPF